MPIAEKAPTMASSSYSGGGATGLAPPIGLGESSSNEEDVVHPNNRRGGNNSALDDSWDPQIIAEGGQPVVSRGGGGATRHITSTAGGDRPSAAETAAAAAALSAAAGGPAAPSAYVGVEVSPTNESNNDDSLLRAATGSAEEAAAAEQAMKRQAQSPFLACADEASAMFREKVNCEYFEERQPSPLKRRNGGDDSDVISLTPSQKKRQQIGGRVVTVGGQTSVTSAKSLNPPSTKGVRGIIQESEEMADEPSPHTARKSQAFFSQLDVNDVKSGTEDEAEEQRQQSPGVAVGSRAAPVSDDDSYFSYERQMQEEMPEDEFNESVGTPPQSQPSNPTGRHIDSSIGAEAAKREEEEEGLMAGMFKTVADICNVDGKSNTKAAAVGGAAAVGVGAAAVAAGSTSKDGTTEESERGLMTDEEGALDVDICSYLHNICGTPVAADDEAPPPPPPLMAGVSASNSRESYDGRAAQLVGLSSSRSTDLSPSRSTDQQENTAIEVEYVDPDYYSSDEDDSGGAGQPRSTDASKKKRKGLGLGKAGKGLSKRMFGKSKKKVGHHESEEKKDEGEVARIAAAAAAAAVGTVAAVGAASAQDRPDDEEDSQGTADHVDDLDEEPEVVRVPNDGLGNPFDENAAADKSLGSESWTVDEKNAHLQAMADKAKDDYMYGQGSPPPSPDRSRDADVAQDDSSVPEDDYADWRPSEKRRFLQLLSQGMSPREAARVIKHTRRGVEQPDLSSHPSVEGAATSESFDGDVIARPEHDEEKKGEDGDIIENKFTEDDFEEGNPEEDHRGVVEAKSREASGRESGQEEEDIGLVNEKENDNSVLAAVVAGGITSAAAIGVAAAIREEDAVPEDVLDETGVSYYDGIKRDDPRDFADAKEAVDSSAVPSQGQVQDVVSSKAKRGKIIPGSLKSKGFASLDSDAATSEIGDRGQSKKSNRKGFSSRLLPSKSRKTKDGFSTLDSDESENEVEEEVGSERAGPSIINKMLRPRPAGFQKMASTGDGMHDSETETTPRGVSSPKDDDTIFDFNEDETVAAAGGTTSRAQPQLHTVEDDHPSSEMSVVSGITMNTTYTDAMSVGTATTSASGKSTRRRHRGAAKKRLSKAKEMEDGKSVGWLDSIRAAAATNNRVWDPQLGWVDYSEPENKSGTLDDSSSIDPIGPLSLSGKVGRSRGVADDNGGNVSKAHSEARSAVPFPEDWEEERSHMIDESYEGNQTEADAVPQAPRAAVASVESDEDHEATSDTMPLVGAAATAAAVASTVPLMVSPQKDSTSDDMTTTSGLTAQTSGATQRRGAPKGWVESMKAAAANVSANDPNRRWDPEHGWIGLPPGTMPPTEASASGNEGGSSNLDTGAESSELNTSRASRSSIGSGPIDLDEEDIGSSTDEEAEEGVDAEADRVAVNTSMISERSAGPVDLDDSDFDDDDSDAGSSVPAPPEAPVSRDAPDAPDAPEGAEDPPAAQDIEDSSLSTATTHLAAGAAVATGAAFAANMASVDAADYNASKQAKPESTSSGPAKAFRLPVPKFGRGGGATQDGYDELASVASENRQADILMARTSNAAVGSIEGEPQKAERYEQFKWDESKDTATSAASSAGTTLPPKPPAKGAQANKEKSAPDVQVIKLKMSEKDKDLFLNKDNSAHFIDDTNFAPEFTDESPFGTPSRSAPRGIEVKDNGIDLDVTASDIIPPQETEDNEGVSSRDPPGTAQIAGTATATAAATAAVAAAVSAEGKAEESSVATRSTLQGEGIDGTSVQSVSSRAKQWMELMESKSKKRVSSNRDIKSRRDPTSSNEASSQGRIEPSSGAGASRNPLEPPAAGLISQDMQDATAGVGAAESKSEASSAIEWPGAGASARRTKSQRGDEWKSFLGKKGQVSASQPQQPQKGGVGGDAFVFSAADGGSEAGIDTNETGFTSQQRKGRSVASNVTDATDEDSIFMFNDGGRVANPLKAKLQDMSSTKKQQQQQQQDRSSSAAAPGSSATSGSSEGEGGQDDGGDGKNKKSFLKRMAECAAPVIPAGCANPTQIDETGHEVPVSHLEFLKNSKVVGSTKEKLKEVSSSTLCGRPDTIIEEKDNKGRTGTRTVPAQEATKPVRSSKGSSASSVVSGNGFGAKSAYLDAIALRAATKKPRRKSGGRSSSSAAGSASSQRSNESSEAWQGFVERRRSNSKSPGPGSAPAATAEEKAAQKVEEMMKAMSMSTKSKEDIDEMIDTMSMSNASATIPSRDPIERTRSEVSRLSQNKPNKKSESAKAAEELAAARVEAMMKAMSSQNLDDEEI